VIAKSVPGTAAWERFGAQIRELRARGGKSQRQVAAEIGIDFTYLSKLENGRAEPPAESTIRRLAAVLGVNDLQLIAAAGKVPAELKQLAATDIQFAYLVNSLPRMGRRQLHNVYAAAQIDVIPIPADEPSSSPLHKRRHRTKSGAPKSPSPT
jgi:transcriptional regulator with XRE-family HTH domain